MSENQKRDIKGLNDEKKYSPPSVRLSLVIPAYNESNRIGETLNQCTEYLAGQDYNSEIIVVDDGSDDGTAEFVRQNFPGARVLAYERNRGKGYAVKQGMTAASGQYRLFYDADGSTPATEIDKIWPPLENGADVVIGSRSSPGSQVEVHQSRLRELMGRTFNRFTRILLGNTFIDTQCGFKVFSAEAAERVFPRQTIDRFGFDSELLYIARLHNLNVAEIPVRWINSPNSRVALIGDSVSMFTDLLRIRLNGIRGRYN